MSEWDLLVFWLVVGSRIFVPLLIPRYPLPAIIASLILDAVDHPIFHRHTNINLDGYQGCDKALDIYYLVIAYIATLRNWTNLFAFKVSRFLIYYRLIGVLLFELTHIRMLLFIFTNTFEYFFIFYEAVRVRWDPKRMGKWVLLGAAGAITLFIKLPQEYIIHISPLHVTALLNKYLFKVDDLEQHVFISMRMRPEITLMLALLAIAALVIVWWIVTRKCPPADWKLKLKADPIPKQAKSLTKRDVDRLMSEALVEKVALVSMVSIIFAQVLPGVKATNLQLVVAVGVIVAANIGISHWLAGKGHEWKSALRELVVMMGVNFGLVLLYTWLLPRFNGSINVGNTLFFVFLLTLMVTMYDRYRVVYLMRFRDKKD